MVSLVVVYHSGFGHTERVAQYVAQGAAGVAGVQPCLMSVEELDWAVLDAADAIIFGAPTYMGSVSATFKIFMDQTSRQWRSQSWKHKVGAGFTNSGGLSGDKLNVLFQLQIFATQHGMIWAGLPQMPTGTGPGDINRMGTYMGLMTQADNAAPDVTPPSGDLKTAEIFGAHVARVAVRWCAGAGAWD